MALFQYFDGEYWQMYSASMASLVGRQKALYKRAKAGDAVAAETLLTLRKDYEYEEWELIDFDDSTDRKRSALQNMFHQREIELRD